MDTQIFYSKKFEIEFWLVPKSWNHFSFVNISPTLVIDTSMERSSRVLHHENPKTWISFQRSSKLNFDLCRRAKIIFVSWSFSYCVKYASGTVLCIVFTLYYKTFTDTLYCHSYLLNKVLSFVPFCLLPSLAFLSMGSFVSNAVLAAQCLLARATTRQQN